MVRSIAAVALFAILLAGCGMSDDTAQACAQLSTSAVGAVESRSGRPCASAITALEYEGGAVWRAVACRPLQGSPGREPMEGEAEA
jgi:hypothetical protein